MLRHVCRAAPVEASRLVAGGGRMPFRLRMAAHLAPHGGSGSDLRGLRRGLHHRLAALAVVDRGADAGQMGHHRRVIHGGDEHESDTGHIWISPIEVSLIVIACLLTLYF